MRSKQSRIGLCAACCGVLALWLAPPGAAGMAAEGAARGATASAAVTHLPSLCARLAALLDAPIPVAERQKALETHRALHCPGPTSEARLPQRDGR